MSQEASQATPEVVSVTGGIDTQAGTLLAIGATRSHNFLDAIGYCLDASDMLAAGSMFNAITHTPRPRFTYR